MARTEIGKYLAIDTRVCGGRLIFKGCRIMVSDAMEMRARGYSPEQIAAQYNGIITPAAVQEASAFIEQGIVKEVNASAKAAA